MWDVPCHADDDMTLSCRCETICEGFSQVKLHADTRPVPGLALALMPGPEGLGSR